VAGELMLFGLSSFDVGLAIQVGRDDAIFYLTNEHQAVVWV
jgi:hypothetical protein